MRRAGVFFILLLTVFLLGFVWYLAVEYPTLVIVVGLIVLTALVCVSAAGMTFAVWDFYDIMKRRRLKRANETALERTQIELAMAEARVKLEQISAQIVRARPGDKLVIKDESFDEKYRIIQVAPRSGSPLALPDGIDVNDLNSEDIAPAIDLTDLGIEYTSRGLIMGQTFNNQLVTIALKSLVHIGVAGTTRWGKSTFQRSLVYQLLLSPEPTMFFLSDISGTTFVDFGVPYVSDLPDTEEMVGSVVGHMERRKSLFEALGQKLETPIKTLDIYNRITDGEKLPQIFMAIDETTILMNQSDILTSQLITLVAGAAKYGIYLCLAAQNWKAAHIDTTIRDQFSSRVQFKAMDKRQAGILIGQSGAETIDIKGRAVAYFPEYGRIVLQTPYLADRTITDTIGRGSFIPPENINDPSKLLRPNSDEEAILNAVHQTRKDKDGKIVLSYVCQLLDRHPSKNAYGRIRNVCAKYGVEI